MTNTSRPALDASSQSRRTDGKFRKEVRCDCCGGTIKNLDYGTDDEVTDGSDGPGFYICERVRCGKKVDGLDVEARRAVYTAQRAKNEAAL